MPQVVIIGAGISGLATAWWLQKQGIDVLVLEKEAQVGGTMRTIRENGWLIETGPNSALETTPLFQTLFEDLGIKDDLVYANEASNKRYILRNGNLHELPMSPTLFLKSKLWSLPGKLRLLKEPFVGRAVNEETVAEFVERRLGRELLDYAINPFVAGVFAGDPEQLSVRAAFPKLYALERNYGGLIKGQILGAGERKKRSEKAKDRARMFSFKNGMQTLPNAIAEALGKRIRTNATVERIEVSQSANGAGRTYEINGAENGRAFSVTCNSVVLAIPSFCAAVLVERFDAPIGKALKAIYYPPVAEVFLGFRTEDVGRPLDGFGFLVPAKEERRILGTIWSSAIFPGRSPSGTVALTTFLGGSRQPDLVQKSKAELIDMVTQELQELMRVKGQPIYSSVTRWEKAIPQYHLGHLSIVEQMGEFERRYPGIVLTGNYRGGISVGDCVTSSEKVAARAMEDLRPSRESITV
ncbi:MAG: protoporphyrinogen oxidase [Ignavibacteriales bacterium]|nr:protoporphyrinogen oxidase [Ignavibacteriales bacterium]